MNKNSILTLIIISLTSICKAGEVIEFDGNKTIREMLLVIKDEIKKGEKKTVNFSTGEFHLISPIKAGDGDQELVETAPPITVELAQKSSLDAIKIWCKTNNVKWVHLEADIDAKSKYFFEIEELLRSEGIQYILSNKDSKKDGVITLFHIPGPPVVPTIPQ